MVESNRQQINEIIQQASKGSKFYLQEQKKLEKLMNRVQVYKKKLKSLNESALASLKRELDFKISSAQNLLFNSEEEFILHVDMDAFYAAVETLDHPEYDSIPMVNFRPLILGRRCRVDALHRQLRGTKIRSNLCDARLHCPSVVSQTADCWS